MSGTSRVTSSTTGVGSQAGGRAGGWPDLRARLPDAFPGSERGFMPRAVSGALRGPVSRPDAGAVAGSPCVARRTRRTSPGQPGQARPRTMITQNAAGPDGMARPTSASVRTPVTRPPTVVRRTVTASGVISDAMVIVQTTPIVAAARNRAIADRGPGSRNEAARPSAMTVPVATDQIERYTRRARAHLFMARGSRTWTRVDRCLGPVRPGPGPRDRRLSRHLDRHLAAGGQRIAAEHQPVVEAPADQVLDDLG